MTILLIILLILLLCGGGLGYNQYGAMGFGPLGLMLIVFLVLYVLGYLH